MPVSEFDAPIPGQALTMAPKSLPSERPPEYADPEDALDWLFKRLSARRQMYNMLALMEGGLSVEALTTILLKQGFVEGKWSAPMIFVMTAPVAMMLVKMAKAAGINYRLYNDKPVPEDLPEIMLSMLAQKGTTATPEKVEAAVDMLEAEIPKTQAGSGRGLGAPKMEGDV